MRILPVVFEWVERTHTETGELEFVMAPQLRYRKIANKQFAKGAEYPLVVLETRSRASHNHYFAAVKDGYVNLPETVQARWLNENHMRKWILCKTGWYDEKETDLDTERDARTFGIQYREFDNDKPLADRDYCRIFVVGKKVIVHRAKSQSAATMGKDMFEQSKKAVLDYIEDVLGVKRGELMRQAGKAA